MDRLKSAQSDPLAPKWGYLFGGFLCFLGLFALSLGLVPLISTLVIKPAVVRMPGQETISLILPGTYVGVCTLEGQSPEDSRKIMDLRYFLSDEKEKDFFAVAKFPPRRYFQENEQNQVPLFQFAVKQKGKYILSSDYPIGIEGPVIHAALFHVDAAYVKSELVVGGLVCLLFCGLGFHIIRKAYKNSMNPAAVPIHPGVKSKKTK